MSAPENSTPSPENRPQGKPGPGSGPKTVTVRIPVAKPEPAAAKAAAPSPQPEQPALRKAAVPPPLPEIYKQPAGQGQPAGEPTTGEVGKPQLKALEIKLSSPPPPSLPAKAPIMAAPRSQGSVWGVRIGMFAGIGLALGVLYWSVFVRLLPITTEHNAKAREMTRAADELELLRRKWSPSEIEETKARHARAQETLFEPTLEANAWQTEVEEKARLGTLEASVKMGEPQPAGAPADGITAIRAEVSVQPSTVLGATVTPYARLLKFTQGLAASPKRLDLLEISVTGDSNSVSQAQAVVQLMMGEKKL